MHRVLLSILFFLLTGSLGYAKHYQVALKDKQGNSYLIGEALVTDSKVMFAKDESVFKDFFLSMKEMKCLEGPEIWCHIPYPYTKEGVNKVNALRWLSHDMLFMYKKHNQFGAQLWQGVYFDLAQSEDGFVGTAYSVDLNELASPPENLSEPPIRLLDLEPLEIDARWLPFMALSAKHE